MNKIYKYKVIRGGEVVEIETTISQFNAHKYCDIAERTGILPRPCSMCGNYNKQGCLLRK